MEALLSKEQLKDIFGSTDVSISERAEYFGNLWDSWEDNQVILPQKAIEQYKNALRLGYTKSIPEIYKEANVKFDFTINHIKELSSFLEKELEKRQKI